MFILTEHREREVIMREIRTHSYHMYICCHMSHKDAHSSGTFRLYGTLPKLTGRERVLATCCRLKSNNNQFNKQGDWSVGSTRLYRYYVIIECSKKLWAVVAFHGRLAALTPWPSAGRVCLLMPAAVSCLGECQGDFRGRYCAKWLLVVVSTASAGVAVAVSVSVALSVSA